MKMLLAIVQDADATNLRQALTKVGVRSTKLASTGGFLRQGNTTFMIGVPSAQVEMVKQVIHKTCRERTQTMMPPVVDEGFLAEPMDVNVGGATVFVLDVEAFEKL